MSFLFVESFGEFIRHFGYLAVLIGTIFEGESSLLPAAFAAQQGYLQLPWIIVIAVIGATAASWFYFFLGRKGGKALLEKHPKWQKRSQRLSRLIEKYPVGILLFYHFLYGLRAMIPLLYGMSRIRTIHFILLAGISTVLWALTISSIEYFFGGLAVQYLDVMKANQWRIGLVLAVIGLLIGLFVKLEWKALLKTKNSRMVPVSFEEETPVEVKRFR